MNPPSEEPALLRGQLLLSTEYVKPDCAVGEALVEIWQETLNIDMVGVHDDFFEIGGDSLSASVIAGAIEIRFGCKFSPSQMVDVSTIAGQAAYVEKQKISKIAVPSNMTVFHEGGKKPPLFFVHGARGFTLYDRRFLDGLDKDRPVIFIEAPGLDGKESAPESVEGMAEHYLKSIRLMAPSGNWLVAANCAGGLIAMEICKQAEQAGEHVAQLMLVDPFSRLFKKPYQIRLMHWRKSLSHLLRPARIRSRHKSSASSSQHGKMDAYEQELDASSRRQALIETRIQTRVGGADNSLVPSSVPYCSEAMREVTTVLHKAFKSYASTRWNGTAFVLMSDQRKEGLKTIKDYLPSAKFRMVPYNHKNLFSDGLPAILEFLDDALREDHEGAFSA